MKLQAMIVAIGALALAAPGRGVAECDPLNGPAFKAMEAYSRCTEGYARAYSRSRDSARDVAIAAVESCGTEMAAQWVESNKCRPGSFDQEQEKGVKEATERSLIRLVVSLRAQGH